MRLIWFATCLMAIPLLCAGDPSYLRDVRPILDKNCTSCHQPASKQSDLDLTTYAGFQAGGKRGPAFVAGSPEQSLVIQFISAALKPSMPFNQPPLAANDVSTIRDWIASGAKDDSPSEMASSEPAVYHQLPVITALRFSPDGKTLAVSGNREVLLHRADGSGLVKRLPGKADRILSIAFSAAGNLMIAGGGQFLENVNQLHGELAAVARHPTADEIVIGGEDRIPYIYRMDRPRNIKVGEDATLIRQLAAQDGAILALDWSPDGGRVAVAGAGPSVNIYDADTGLPLASCKGHTAGIYAVAFSPDSTHLATGGFDGQVRLYSTNDCTLEKSFVPVPLFGGAQ